MSGRAVGHYLLIGLIGKGGYSHVYLAEHQTLKRKMAVKLLSPRLIPTPDHTAKLATEAVALAKVEHQNIVRIYDFGTEGGIPYIAMEYVDGKSLEEVIRTSGPLPIDRAIEITADLLEGLRAIHEAALLHRDIKPSNTLISREGTAKLADFGLAREIPTESDPRSNLFVGTADYAAPELAVGRPPDVRSDLYALGGTVYKTLTGRAPFSGNTPAEKLSKQLYDPLIPPRFYNQKIPQALEGLILRLLNKERDQRPSSASEAMKLIALLRRDKSAQGRDKRHVVLVKRPSRVLVPLVSVGSFVLLAGILALVTLRKGKSDELSQQGPITVVPAAPEVTRPPTPLPDDRKDPSAVIKPSQPNPPENGKTEPRGVPSVLLLRSGSHVAGLVVAREEGYEVVGDAGRLFIKKSEVIRLYQSSQEMASEADGALSQAGKLYEAARTAQNPRDQEALLREAQHQAELARDRYVLTRKYFSGEADSWLNHKVLASLAMIRLARDAQGTRTPPSVVVQPPSKPEPKPPKGRSLDATVLGGLNWLARHQGSDGGWKVQNYLSECRRYANYGGRNCSPNPGHDDFDGGVTGLALLAFLGAGYSHSSQDTYDGLNFGEVIRNAIQWILSHQDPQGYIGSYRTQKYMYSHTLATHALAEWYRSATTTGNPEKGQVDQWRKSLLAAVNFIIGAQNPGKGWRYSARCGDNDTSVTATVLLSLEAARRSSVQVPAHVFEGGLDWFTEVSEAFGRAGYTNRGTGKVYVPGLNENFDHHETLTAAVEACSSIVKGSARLNSPRVGLLLKDLPRWDGNCIDFYYWYYGTRMMKQVGSAAQWAQWKDPLVAALGKNQNLTDGQCTYGSWEPIDRWSGEGGRVYTTALGVLTLEYALLARPFTYAQGPSQPPQDPASQPEFRWEFHLKSGGKLRVISYEEKDDKYVLKVAAGTTTILKEGVEKIEKYDAKKRE
jgi:serine/threonine protein kinase